MSASTLPGELTDKIVDCFSPKHDRNVLRACLFISRDFRARARYHLFNEILLEENNMDKFRDNCKVPPEWAYLVRRLRIQGSPNKSASFEKFPGHAVASNFSHFENVVALTMDRVHVDDKLAESITQGLPMLQHLYIHTYSLQSTKALYDLLSPLKHIQDLKLKNLFRLDDPSSKRLDIPAADTPLWPALLSLSLSSHDQVVPLILNQFVNRGMPEGMSNFRFPDMHSEDLGHVQSFLDAANKRIRDVYIGYEDTPVVTLEGRARTIDLGKALLTALQAPILDLSKASMLQHLSLKLDARFPNTQESDVEEDQIRPAPNRWVSKVLETLTTTQLKTIQFVIYGVRAFKDDILANTGVWTDIAQTLQKLPAFSGPSPPTIHCRIVSTLPKLDLESYRERFESILAPLRVFIPGK